MTRIALHGLLAGLTCCSEQAATVVDGSSPAAFAASVEAARHDLPVTDRLAFDSAIASVPARRYADRDPAATARAAFDGLTAAEIVDGERERFTGR